MRLQGPVLPNLRDGYVEVAQGVLRGGRRREARGYGTRDVRGASFTVEDTRAVIPYGVGRPTLNDDIGYAEALLLCAGVGSPSLLTSVTGSFRRFVDGGQLNTYGPLVRAQMESVVRALSADRDTRQATLRVNRGLHEHEGSRDVPCTLSLGFALDAGGLHLLATMRSNDAFLGLTYDAFMFCQLGWTVANALGVELKTYTHQAYSLHVYDRDAEKVEALHAYDGSAPPEPSGFGAHSPGSRPAYEPARRTAEAVYNRAADRGSLTESERMFADRLDGYDRLTLAAGFAA